MKLVFIGSGEFAVPTLRALAKVTQVRAVVTQPDRPAGRGLQLKPTPAKEEAQRFDLPIHQFERLKEPSTCAQLEAYEPDVLVVASYGKIVPQSILDVPRIGAINLHASLLPKYRGAAPIHWAIIEGEWQTGVTTFFMDTGMDTGPLLMHHAVRIDEDDNVLTLESKLAQVGALLMLETLERLSKDALRPVPQDEALATKAPKLKKQDGQINWHKSAHELYNFVRGTYPYPGAYTFLQAQRLKVHSAAIADEAAQGTPGEITGVMQNTLLVQTGRGVLELVEVQPASRPRMSAGDFARGQRLGKNQRLG